VIIADMEQNQEGKRIYLLAQGFMPAQDIHIVINPLFPDLSPWYILEYGFRDGHFPVDLSEIGHASN
jgi:hypothetical protein